MNITMQKGYHIKVSVTGKPERIFLFQYMVSECDGDWPYRFAYNPKRGQATLRPVADKVCNRCGGVFWRSPRLLSQRLRGLGKQCGISVKVRTFAQARNCANKGS